MKRLKSLSWVFGAALAATLVVACGKSGDGGGGSVATPVYPIVGPQMQLPTTTQVGFYAQNTKMDRYYQNNGSSFVPDVALPKVLKYAMRTCDRGESNGGMATCQAFLSGLQDIMIFANGTQANSVTLVVRAAPDSACQSPYYCSNYWYSLPSFQQMMLGFLGLNAFNNSQVYNPMKINMTVWPINDSKGFELRGYAPGGDLYYGSGNLLFQFQVANGKFEDLSWDYRLVYNGEIAATGRMLRCQTMNCGIQSY